MADWLPRKVIGDRGLVEAVPGALEAWIRYAGRAREIPTGRSRSVGAIPEWVDEIVERASDPAAAGPAKQFVAAAKSAGVDLADERAVANFVAGWNARSDAE